MAMLTPHIFERLYSLLAYHRPNQLLHRFAKKILTPLKHSYFRLYFKFKSRTPHSMRASVATAQDSSEAVLLLKRVNPKFPNLNNNFENLDSISLLKQFEIHCHRNLLFKNPDLELWHEVVNWMTRFPFSERKSYQVSWHPYVCSKRIQHWLALWLLVPPTAEIQPQILNLMVQQLAWIEANMERDIGGNHLWENAQALILGGLFFSGKRAERWLGRGIKTLKHCLSNQILPSGEHAEKSPSYHWELVSGLKFTLTWLKWYSYEEVHFFIPFVAKMEEFASRIAHPSGLLPYFNDSWEVRSPVEQGVYCDWVGDYFVQRKSGMCFIFDAGNLGDDALPAHSHCDLLTFELSLNDSPLFINSGTYCYQGPKRNLYRQSRAHNVLTVNDTNSADIWSSFRMGRRGHVLNKKMLKDPFGTWIMASHDAYKHLGFAETIRIWFITKNGDFLCSFHFVKNHSTRAIFKEYVHLHPDSKSNLRELRPVGDNSEWELDLTLRNSSLIFRSLIPSTGIDLEDSLFSPFFDLEIPNKTIALQNHSSLKADCGALVSAWCLYSLQKSPNISMEFENMQIKLKWTQNNETLQSICSL